MEGVNIHGVAMVAWKPSGMPEKSPVLAATFEKPRFPNTSRHSITWVTLSRCDESNITAASKVYCPVYVRRLGFVRGEGTADKASRRALPI